MLKKLILSIAMLIGTMSFAFAHHPLDSMPMETFFHGLLSGIAHPILGFDHLIFVALVGIASLTVGLIYRGPLTYMVTMIFGALIASTGFLVFLPLLIEGMIIISLIALGYIMLSARKLSTNAFLGLFAISGIFHGSAFGESILGEPHILPTAALLGYLIGLFIIQCLIAIGMAILMTRIYNLKAITEIPARFAGAFVLGVGVFLAYETIEILAFELLI